MRFDAISCVIKKNVGYSLYPAQLAVAEAVKRRLDKAKVSLIIAECGSGKTKIGTVALAAHQNGRKCLNVVLCPSHVTKKWAREIEETLPNTKAAVVKSLQDIDRVYEDYVQGNKSLYIILSKERARDGYMRKPAVVYSISRKGFICPTCYHVIEEEIKKDGSKYTIRANQFFFNKENTQNHKCPHCGAPLWTAINPNDMNIRHNNWIKLGDYGFIYRPLASWHLTGNNLKVMDRIEEIVQNPDKIISTKGAVRRYPLASYISERFHKIDGFIADELHLFKGDSGQGNAMETLIGCSRKVIGMTATLINGYSSGMFYLLYRVVPRLMRLDNKEFNNPSPFNKEYGVSEKLYEIFNPDKSGEYNANSRAVKFLVREKQVPGVSPLVYSRFLLDSAVFLSLSDIGKHLPDYEEIPVELSLSEPIKEEYERISQSFINLMKSHESIDMRAQRRVMSKFMSLLSTYPDQPYGNDPIFYPGSEKPIVVPEELSSIDELHEKDTAVLDIVERKVKNGERVMIFANWVKIDTEIKLAKILTEKGYRVAVLEQRVPPEKREEWVNKRIEEGLDVLITNASLIETGLDLNAFTTLIYYNIGYNLFTFRQSSRRSWRINQTAPRIEVYLLYYKGVMQANAIKLMASKLAAATLVEGNFSEEGLAAMSDCQDMTSQLATTLMSGIKDDVEDISDMFKKMAVIKDETIDTEDDTEYLITETDIKVKVVNISEMSVSEKIKRARQLVTMMTQKKEKTNVNIIPPQTDGFYQFSLFDEAC